jgi:hypothetical protein
MNISGKIPKSHLQAINFFASKLFTPQKRRHLYLHVKYCRKKSYEHGNIAVDDYNVLGMPIGFVMEIYRDTEEEMLKTIAHEMIHCSQYSRGELNETMTMWRGRLVNSDEIPYHEQPWEIAAESKGLELYDEYIKSKT